jgi:polyhydroxybutyrate depolymerase
MRSPALAIAWEFRRRHRWGLVGLAGYVLVVAGFKLLIFEPGQTATLDPPDGTAAVVIVPLTTLFFYLIAVFSFGFGGDLAARRSSYPTRMFALPVTTAALAGWPMLYGALAMLCLWLVTVLLGSWALGIDAPVIWPALYAAVFLAWTQVLAWMPFGVRGLRVVAAVAWLATLNAVVFSAISYEVSETVMAAILAPLLPLAYLCAWFVVARARSGDLPDWRGVFAGLQVIAHLGDRRRNHFSSPTRAQRWFEWRQLGWSLPVWVTILLPVELALLLLPGNDTPELVFYTLLTALLTPPFMAAFVTATARRSDADASDVYGLAPFIATRPVTNATLVAAKLIMAAWSTFAAWFIVLVAIPLGLTLSGTWPIVTGWARQWVDAVGTPRLIALALLALAVLLASTWKQLVQAQCITLAGRAWLVKASVLLRLALLIAILAALEWILDNRMVAALWRALPWILAGLVGIKLSVAGWTATRLAHDRLLSDRVLVAGAAGWLVTVLAVHGLLAWLLSLSASMPRHLLGLLAILSIPLARPSVAPLALAWNRHRGKRENDVGPTTDLGHRRRALATVLILIGLPAVLTLAEASSVFMANRTNGVITASLQGREYLLYVPESHNPTEPTPLVISLHGGGSYPAQQMHLSRWNAVAEEHGFLVVYPSGSGFPRVWEVREPGAGLTAEVGFISALIDRLRANYTLDPSRIYADGLSNGGGMAFVLSCTLSDRIAAVGLVASAQFLPWDWCTDQQAVPMMAFHGTQDRLAQYHGGESWVTPHPFANIPDWVANWAGRNRCAPTPVEAEVAGTSAVGHMRTVRTTRTSCSTRSRAAATPGRVASRCRNGWPARPPTTSTPAV